MYVNHQFVQKDTLLREINIISYQGRHEEKWAKVKVALNAITNGHEQKLKMLNNHKQLPNGYLLQRVYEKDFIQKKNRERRRHVMLKGCPNESTPLSQ